MSLTHTEAGACTHCGGRHTGACPRVKSIEFHRDGTVKRVEYHPWAQPFLPPASPIPVAPLQPANPWGPWCTPCSVTIDVTC
jgi:hypothetical protein